MVTIIEREVQRGPAKAAYGSPCNGCGLCCMHEPCPMGAAVFEQDTGPCPALEYQEAKFVCGLTIHPEKYAKPRVLQVMGADRLSTAAVHLIGVGQGCDAQLEGEPDAPAWRERLRKIALIPSRRVLALVMLARWFGVDAGKIEGVES